MKISKSQQEQNRRLVIRTAVDLIGQHGYDATTMKQIARAAGIGDATIYKYFPTKEKLLLGYFELTLADALTQTAQTTGFEEFSLQEKLQRLVDAVLELLLADREFVEITRQVIGKLPLMLMRDNIPGQQSLKEQVIAFIEAAEQADEIAPCDFKSIIGGLFADYLFAVVAYWLKDESDEFSDTTQLVDLTLGVLVLALKSGVLNKLSELASFMFRSQMSRMMQHGSGLLDTLKLVRRGIDGLTSKKD
ncbi:MAG: TetR/AcrR family transcriptional regulator [Pseudomonadota bacterium]